MTTWLYLHNLYWDRLLHVPDLVPNALYERSSSTYLYALSISYFLTFDLRNYI